MALTNKSYFGYNAETGETKQARKGIPYGVKLALDDFKDILFRRYRDGETVHTVTIESLRFDRDKKISHLSCLKRGLNDTFYKKYVHDDAITLSPLKDKHGRLL